MLSIKGEGERDVTVIYKVCITDKTLSDTEYTLECMKKALVCVDKMENKMQGSMLTKNVSRSTNHSDIYSNFVTVAWYVYDEMMVILQQVHNQTLNSEIFTNTTFINILCH